MSFPYFLALAAFVSKKDLAASTLILLFVLEAFHVLARKFKII